MKKIVSSLLAGAIAFSTFLVGNVTPSSAPTVASAKSTAKLLDEGGDKVLKYLYSKNPSYKKTRVLITEQRKLKSGNLFYGVHEDNPKSPAMMRIGFYHFFAEYPSLKERSEWGADECERNHFARINLLKRTPVLNII